VIEAGSGLRAKFLKRQVKVLTSMTFTLFCLLYWFDNNASDIV